MSERELRSDSAHHDQKAVEESSAREAPSAEKQQSLASAGDRAARQALHSIPLGTMVYPDSLPVYSDPVAPKPYDKYSWKAQVIAGPVNGRYKLFDGCWAAADELLAAPVIQQYSPALLRAAISRHDVPAAIRLTWARPVFAVEDLRATGSMPLFIQMIRDSRAQHTRVETELLGDVIATLSGKEQEQLFEATVGVSAPTNDPYMGNLCELVTRLPLSHLRNQAVEYDAKKLPDGSAGAYSWDSKQIILTNEADGSEFLHEVGHAIDDRLGAKSEHLRRSLAGWKIYDDVQSFLADVGGFDQVPTEYRELLVETLQLMAKTRLPYRALGEGISFGDALSQAAQGLHGMPFTSARFQSAAADQRGAGRRGLLALAENNPCVRICSGIQGPDEFAAWPSNGSRHFFVNNYYGKFASVPGKLHHELVQWGNSKAAYFDSEWFAECYSAYYQSHAAFYQGTAGLPQYVFDFFTNTVDKVA